MTPERWQQIAQLYETALDRSPDTRAAFLAEQCGTDEDVRREVEALLAKSNASLIVDRPLAKTAASVLGVAPRLTPGTTLGPYRVDGLLGAGGMGEVYRARDTKLNRDVALKVLPETFTADRDRVGRFLREAQVLASLNDPHIAAIHGYEDSGAVHALVLELVEGPTLADRIAQGPVPLDEALGIARQIADALATAHDHGIIHRDLKPANIKVRDDGAVKVLDFGLAKALTESPNVASVNLTNSPTLTSPMGATGIGVLLGTAAYMSPEQAKGRPVDKRTDIWAFGCVLYEILTGRPAFGGDDVSETLAAVLRSEPDWTLLPSETPSAVRILVERCLAKDRRQRVGDIAAARFALTEASKLEPRPIEASRTMRWKRVLPVAAATVLSGALVGGVAWSLSSSASPPIITRFSIPLPEGQRLSNLGNRNVAFSPDGTQIVYVANQRLYRRSMSERQPTLIQGTEATRQGVTNPTFSPDGRSVVYWSGDDQTLKRIPIAGGIASTICPAVNPYGVSWDKDQIVFG